MEDFNLSKNEIIKCTAGLNYFQLYPNGDLYRCMRYYGTRQTPLQNVKDGFNKQEIISKLQDISCPMKKCHEMCDRDWAKKWIVDEDTNKVRAVVDSGHLETRFGEQKIDDIKNNQVKIFWAPTMVCNYNCNYCHCVSSKIETEKRFPSSGNEATDEEWLKAFLQIKDSYDYGVITTNGGEPFLRLPGIINVIEHLQDKFLFAITTNLSFSVFDFTRRIKPHNIAFNLSLHPTDRKFSFEIFHGRALLLKNTGYDVKVNYVGYPEQLFLYEKYKEIFERDGIHVELIPFIGATRDDKNNSSQMSGYERFFINSRASLETRQTDVIVKDISEKETKPNEDYYLEELHGNTFFCKSLKFSIKDNGPILYFLNSEKEPVIQLIKDENNLFISYHKGIDEWIKIKVLEGFDENSVFKIDKNSILINEISVEEILDKEHFDFLRLDFEKSNFISNKNLIYSNPEPENTLYGIELIESILEFKDFEEKSENISLGAFYYSWYSNPGWRDRTARYNLYKGKPSLGWYDSCDRKTLSKHEDMARYSGIDFFISSFNGNHDLDSLIFMRDNLKDVKMCIHYETVNIFQDPSSLEGDNLKEFTQHIEIIVEEFMKSSNYYEIDGKPVIFIYTSRRVLGNLNEIDIIRKIVKEKTGKDCLIFGDEIWWKDEDYIGDPKRIEKFDYIYPYNLYVPIGDKKNSGFSGKEYLDFIEPVYVDFKDKADILNVGICPVIMPRYNDLYVRDNVGHYPISDNEGLFYENYFHRMKKYMSGKNKVMAISSFNEWYEDTQIESYITVSNGDEYDSDPSYENLFLDLTKKFKKEMVKKFNQNG